MIRRKPSSLAVFALVATAVALAGSGCKSSTDPGQQVQGTFQLETINGDSLPYEYDRKVVEGMTITRHVIDARLEFRTRNRVFDIRIIDFIDTNPDTIVASYRLDGNTLLLTYPARPGVPSFTDTASFNATSITVLRKSLPAKADANDLFYYIRTP